MFYYNSLTLNLLVFNEVYFCHVLNKNICSIRLFEILFEEFYEINLYFNLA